jgi:NAD(P)H-nitrite reductase large subunit
MSSTTFYHTNDCAYCKKFSKYDEDHPNYFEKVSKWTKHLGFKTYKDFVTAEMKRIKEIDKRENEREANEREAKEREAKELTSSS